MIHVHRWITLVAASAFCAAAVAAPSKLASELSEFESVHKKLTDSMVGTARTSQELKIAFDRLRKTIPEGQTVRALSTPDLKRLFKAADTTFFYSNDNRYLEAMQDTLAELLRRKAATHYFLMTMYDGYVTAADFDIAKRFQKQHKLPMKELLPETIQSPQLKSASATEWRIESSGRTMTRVPVEFPSGPYVVVVSSPYCHFAREAMKALHNDPELLRILEGRVKWLVPLDSNFSFDDLQKWNNQRSQFEFVLANNPSEWPMIKEWATPNFHFFKNGEFTSSFSGWPTNGGNKPKLVEELRKIGFVGLPQTDKGATNELAP